MTVAGALLGDIKTIECPECGKNMFLRQGKKGKFWGCDGYPN